MQKFIRKITKKNRYSYATGLPKKIMDKLKWRDGQKITIRQSGKKIIIEDWQPKK